MARPLQVSLLGGSVASLLWRGLEELSTGAESTWVCPECISPAAANLLDLTGLDLRSFILGSLFGLLLGPLIDFLYLFRVWWCATVREQARALGARPPLFRVVG